VHALSRYASAVRARAVADLTEPRQMVTLGAFAAVMRNRAADELLSDLARTSAKRQWWPIASRP
jgi:hypothetical protein